MFYQSKMLLLYISLYSGGEQRRASLAVSLIQQPPLLILDEPTVGMDTLLRQRFNLNNMYFSGITFSYTSNLIDIIKHLPNSSYQQGKLWLPKIHINKNHIIYLQYSPTTTSQTHDTSCVIYRVF